MRPLPAGFDARAALASNLLRLSPLSEADRDALARAASDPLIWAGHPAKDRHKPEVFHRYFDSLLAGGGSLTVRSRETDTVIGTSRFYATEDTPGGICIGFTFLTRDHWGGATNLEMKRLMIGHIFRHRPEVWFHIGLDNVRSQKATAKLGARRMDDQPVDIGNGPVTMCRYKLTPPDWQARMSANP